MSSPSRLLDTALLILPSNWNGCEMGAESVPHTAMEYHALRALPKSLNKERPSPKRSRRLAFIAACMTQQPVSANGFVQDLPHRSDTRSSGS